MTLLAWVYYRYKGLSLVQDMLACLRPAVVAMIASAGISLFILALFGQGGRLVDLNYVAAVVFILGFLLLRLKKPNPIWIMAGSGALFTGISLLLDIYKAA